MDSKAEKQVIGKKNRKNKIWQGFHYWGESVNHGLKDINNQTLTKINITNEKIAPENATFSLATAKVGDLIRIVSLNCNDANNRLMGMGLMPGVQLQVVSVTGTGSAIVALDNNRLGLEAKMAQQIQVQKVDFSINTRANPTNTNAKAISQKTVSDQLKLREATIGSTLKVVAYAAGGRDYKRKLLAMGLIPGTEFVVKRHAPLGDPTEIEIRGFHLTLRKDEADALIVESV